MKSQRSVSSCHSGVKMYSALLQCLLRMSCRSLFSECFCWNANVQLASMVCTPSLGEEFFFFTSARACSCARLCFGVRPCLLGRLRRQIRVSSRLSFQLNERTHLPTRSITFSFPLFDTFFLFIYRSHTQLCWEYIFPAPTTPKEREREREAVDACDIPFLLF